MDTLANVELGAVRGDETELLKDSRPKTKKKTEEVLGCPPRLVDLGEERRGEEKPLPFITAEVRISTTAFNLHHSWIFAISICHFYLCCITHSSILPSSLPSIISCYHSSLSTYPSFIHPSVILPLSFHPSLHPSFHYLSVILPSILLFILQSSFHLSFHPSSRPSFHPSFRPGLANRRC